VTDPASVFQILLGNIEAGGEVKIRYVFSIHFLFSPLMIYPSIFFVSIVAQEGIQDSLAVTVPLAVAPYYGTPSTATRSTRSTQQALSNRPTEVTVSFEMTAPIASIASASHPITTTLGRLLDDSAGANAVATHDPRHAHVRVETDGLLSKDIVLTLKVADLDKPRCVVERRHSGASVTDAFALTFVPRFNLPPIKAQQYLFVVDRSGSMEGQRIAKTRSALQIILRALPARGTSFNIISFGSSWSALWKTSQQYSKESVDEASRHADRMKADFGGTEIRGALEYTFGLAGDSGHNKTGINEPTAVFVLTDGEAWDIPGIVGAVDGAVVRSQGLLCVFVLGVGEQVSKAVRLLLPLTCS